MDASRTRRLLVIAAVLAAVTGLGIAVTRAAGTGPSVHAQPPSRVVEVAAIVDGDTFDVRAGSDITAIARVRLAYVRTPRPSRPDQPPACLAADATAHLASIMPTGTRVTLTYEKERTGYPAAEVVAGDGRLVNAEMVRAGYAQVVEAGLESPMPPAVSEAVGDAAQEAAASLRGLHSADISCTVPGQVKAVTDAVARIPTSPGPVPTAVFLAGAAGQATVARMAAEELGSAFAQDRQDVTWLSLGPQERDRLRAQVQDARDDAADAETLLRDATSMTVNRDVTQASTQRDAARIAKVLADLRKAELDRAARAARRAAAARKAQADALAETRARADAARARRERAEQTSAQREKARRERASSEDSDARGSNSSGSRGD